MPLCATASIAGLAPMTCCIVALALVWQLLSAWRRLRHWLGFAPRELSRPRTTGVAAAALVDGLRRHAPRAALGAFLILGFAATGAYAYEHRFHVGTEIGAAVFDLTGFAQDLCRNIVATAP